MGVQSGPIWLPEAFHRKGLHTTAYYRYLEKKLAGIDDAAEIISVLNKVAEELAAGIKRF